MMEAICWVFSTTPSGLDDLLWTVTLEDIRIKLKLKVGYEQAIILQQFSNVATIVSKALGGGKEEKGEAPKDIVDAQLQLNSVFMNR